MRDKFLIEAMGYEYYYALNCYVLKDSPTLESTVDKKGFDFSTWEGFGRLWGWTQKQKWFETFCMEGDFGHPWGSGVIPCDHDASWIDAMIDIVHPDRFADAVYEYLKGVE